MLIPISRVSTITATSEITKSYVDAHVGPKRYAILQSFVVAENEYILM